MTVIVILILFLIYSHALKSILNIFYIYIKQKSILFTNNGIIYNFLCIYLPHTKRLVPNDSFVCHLIPISILLYKFKISDPFAVILQSPLGVIRSSGMTGSAKNESVINGSTHVMCLFYHTLEFFIYFVKPNITH